MVTNSRTTLRSPISSRVGSPRYFRSWGARPTEQNGKRWLSRADAWCRRRSRRGTRRRCRAPIRTCGPDHRSRRPRARPARAPPPAPRARSGSTSGAGRVGDLQQQAWPPPRGARRSVHLARARGRAARAGAARCTSRRSWSPGTAGRRNLASSMPTTWTSRRLRVGGVLRAARCPAAWARLSMSSTPGHHRRAREVALEELLGAGDVLDRDQAARGVVLEHAVHEHERVLGGDLADQAARCRWRALMASLRRTADAARRRGGCTAPRSGVRAPRRLRLGRRRGRGRGGRRGSAGRRRRRPRPRRPWPPARRRRPSRSRRCEMSNSLFTVSATWLVEDDVDALLLGHGLDVRLDLRLELVVEPCGLRLRPAPACAAALPGRPRGRPGARAPSSRSPAASCPRASGAEHRALLLELVLQGLDGGVQLRRARPASWCPRP